MQRRSPAAGSRIGFPGCSRGLALASALLALSLGLLIATVTAPQGEASKAIDGWRRLMSGDPRSLLVSAIPCLAWLAAVVAFIRNSPERAAARAGLQVPVENRVATPPSTPPYEKVEPDTPAPVRKSFRNALREDGVVLAGSRPRGRSGR